MKCLKTKAIPDSFSKTGIDCLNNKKSLVRITTLDM